MSKRSYELVIKDESFLDKLGFCPYCGSETVTIYQGDWMNHTECFDCDVELELIRRKVD